MIGYKIDWSRKYEYYDICEPYMNIEIGKRATIKEDAPEEAKTAFNKFMAILDDQVLCKEETGDSVRF